MMSISSQAGRRLAAAKAALDALDDTANRPAIELSDEETRAVLDATWEWSQAANAVADELIAAGFHEMEGE